MSTEAARFSIKQRLKSANHSLPQPERQSPRGSSRQIHAPEHYNYFITTLHKELRHEECLYKNIRKKIDNLKAKKQSGKISIKNAYAFSHKSFVSSVIKNGFFQNRKLQAKTAYQSPRNEDIRCDLDTMELRDP